MEITIGERIKSLRLDGNYTQQQVADAVGITKSLVSMIESGKRAPGRNAMIKIAEFFNVSLDYLSGAQIELRPIGYVRESFTGFKNTPAVPMYDCVASYDKDEITGYATTEDLLVENDDGNMFFAAIEDEKGKGWVLANNLYSDKHSTFLIKDGDKFKVVHVDDLTEDMVDHIVGSARSITYIF
ncbi:MAG: helix-turn-helix transcriptional regulator [Clostridia bacterium]|nr:helix-turn-helix transcriptional regulator [Clostridia bacterium]